MAANGAAGPTKVEMQHVLETTDLSPTALNAANQSASKLLNPNPA
jgi:hypothetical protein